MSRFIKTVYHYMYFGCVVHKKLYRFCNIDIFSSLSEIYERKCHVSHAKSFVRPFLWLRVRLPIRHSSDAATLS